VCSYLNACFSAPITRRQRTATERKLIKERALNKGCSKGALRAPLALCLSVCERARVRICGANKLQRCIETRAAHTQTVADAWISAAHEAQNPLKSAVSCSAFYLSARVVGCINTSPWEIAPISYIFQSDSFQYVRCVLYSAAE
jgi:hypothetical protein